MMDKATVDVVDSRFSDISLTNLLPHDIEFHSKNMSSLVQHTEVSLLRDDDLAILTIETRS